MSRVEIKLTANQSMPDYPIEVCCPGCKKVWYKESSAETMADLKAESVCECGFYPIETGDYYCGCTDIPVFKVPPGVCEYCSSPDLRESYTTSHDRSSGE